ncbi:YwqG family protein [Streptomyces sp. NBC_01537]|uniref:DUF1963 domain-containing protein n=1 Tax=Streptomyces sp. NBC_01537 TaxID=2903896 RepID=UPI0038660A2F
MLKEKVIRALNARSWPSSVIEALGSRIGDAVGPTLRSVVGGQETGQSTPVELGCSKLGGLPHVDDSFTWPTEDGTDEPLALVCQLNLGEVSAADRTALPAAGMFYLFSIYDGDRAYGYEIDETTAEIVHIPQPGPLTTAERPEGLDDDGVFEERRLRLAPSLVCEAVGADGKPDSAVFDHSVVEAIEETLVANGGCPAALLRLLGNPHLRDREDRLMFDSLTHTLLLYIDGYAADRNAFGEGSFHVLIGNGDLERGQLGRAEILYRPGT